MQQNRHAKITLTTAFDEPEKILQFFGARTQKSFVMTETMGRGALDKLFSTLSLDFHEPFICGTLQTPTNYSTAAVIDSTSYGNSGWKLCALKKPKNAKPKTSVHPLTHYEQSGRPCFFTMHCAVVFAFCLLFLANDTWRNRFDSGRLVRFDQSAMAARSARSGKSR